MRPVRPIIFNAWFWSDIFLSRVRLIDSGHQLGFLQPHHGSSDQYQHCFCQLVRFWKQRFTCRWLTLDLLIRRPWARWMYQCKWHCTMSGHFWPGSMLNKQGGLLVKQTFDCTCLSYWPGPMPNKQGGLLMKQTLLAYAWSMQDKHTGPMRTNVCYMVRCSHSKKRHDIACIMCGSAGGSLL